jgi:hypothetical protein
MKGSEKCHFSAIAIKTSDGLGPETFEVAAVISNSDIVFSYALIVARDDLGAVTMWAGPVHLILRCSPRPFCVEVSVPQPERARKEQF